MMSLAVIEPTYGNRRHLVKGATERVVARPYVLRHSNRMLDTDELLARLDQKKIRNIDIARALGLPDSRVPEIRRKERALKLDEGAKLVRAFGLEPALTGVPLPPPILRLAIQYVALELGVPLEANQSQLEELTEDLRAFSEFAVDPNVRRSVDAAEGFFQAMRRRRPVPSEEAQPGTDPAPAE